MILQIKEKLRLQLILIIIQGHKNLLYESQSFIYIRNVFLFLANVVIVLEILCSLCNICLRKSYS